MAHRPAKITRPRTSGAIARPRLFAQLDRVRREGAALWVSGPPGAGKTTLVARWVELRRTPTLWLRVDPGDGDLATFFHYLALAARAATRRRVTFPALTPEYRDTPDPFARLFFRRLFASLPPRAGLVFDDCHEVPADAAFHGALRAAVEELVPGVTLAMLGRGDPPTAFSRLRANGALAVVGRRELELSEGESWAIARARGFAGRRDRVEALRRTVHGWAAGLVLALARAEEERVSVDPRTATFDYFASEVFQRADAAARRVLLEAALLEAPTAELVESATGRKEAGRILSGFARRGLFTLRHDGREPAFEFHALFREFLLARGQGELPTGRAAEIRRAAAVALSQRPGADAEEAIQLLADVGDFEEMGRLVAREAEAAIRAGRWQTVAGWIERIPEEVRDANPWLLHWSGVALVPRDPVAARACLARALTAFERAGDAAGAWLAWAATVEAIRFEWKDFTPLSAAFDELERLRARLAFPSPEIAARVTVSAFTAAIFHRPHHPSLPAWAEEMRSIAREAPDAAARVMAGANVALYDGWLLGEIGRARALLRELRAVAADPALPPGAAFTWESMCSPILCAAGEFEAAAAAAARTLAAGKEHGIHVWDFTARVQEFAVAAVTGEGSLRPRIAAMEDAIHPDSGVDLAMIRVSEGLAAMHEGNARGAVALGEEALAVATRFGYPAAQILARMLLARARPQTGDLPGGRAELDGVRAEGARIGSSWIACVVGLIEAEHHLDGRSRAAARPGLAAGFGLMREKGLHPQLLFTRADLSRLCAAALDAGIEEDVVRAFVRSRDLAPPAGAEVCSAWPWRIRIHALGAFGAERDGTALAVTSRSLRKPMELLRALIAHGGRDVAKDALAEALWPAADGDAAHHVLETTLYRLRRTMGQAIVLQHDRRLSLAADRCWSDVLELEACLGASLAALDRKRCDPERVAGDAQRIADLYRGPLLADGPDAPWVTDARERLRRTLRRWLRALAASPGGPALAATVAARLREADPELGLPPTLYAAS